MNVSGILLVDDDSASIFIARHALKKYNPQVTITSVSNGEDALRYIQESVPGEDPDAKTIILLDITMPVMNGFLFINRFNKLDETIKKRFKILVYSSFVDIGILKDLLPLGITGSIEKPLTEQKIKLYIDNDKI